MAINRRDDVQSKIHIIKRAIGSKAEPSAYPRTGVAYERRSGRAEVDGVQQAAATKRVRGHPVEHASARLPRDSVESLGKHMRAVAVRRGIALVAATADERFAKTVSDRTLTLEPATGRLKSGRRNWFG